MANPEEHAKAAYGRGSVYAHEALQEAREHGKKERRIAAQMGISEADMLATKKAHLAA